MAGADLVQSVAFCPQVHLFNPISYFTLLASENFSGKKMTHLPSNRTLTGFFTVYSGRGAQINFH